MFGLNETIDHLAMANSVNCYDLVLGKNDGKKRKQKKGHG